MIRSGRFIIFPPADKQNNFISLIHISRCRTSSLTIIRGKLGNELRSGPVLKLWMADSQYWACASSFLVVMPPPPPLPPPPPPPLPSPPPPRPGPPRRRFLSKQALALCGEAIFFFFFFFFFFQIMWFWLDGAALPASRSSSSLWKRAPLLVIIEVKDETVLMLHSPQVQL